jgi:hypothetical protein
MLALVVLATDLPMPERITFQGEGIGEPGASIMSLSFSRIEPGKAWSRYLGGCTDTYHNRDGNTYLREGVIEWHGWSLHLHACEPTSPDTDLDQETAIRLAELAGGAA